MKSVLLNGQGNIVLGFEFNKAIASVLRWIAQGLWDTHVNYIASKVFENGSNALVGSITCDSFLLNSAMEKIRPQQNAEEEQITT